MSSENAAVVREWEPMPSWKCDRFHTDAQPRIVPVGEECPACGYDEEGADHEKHPEWAERKSSTPNPYLRSEIEDALTCLRNGADAHHVAYHLEGALAALAAEAKS